jgi:polyhydroxyalkanoate synthesis regulator phasin
MTMIETFKKTLLAGLGAAVVTREKVQAGLDEFVKQGKISATDARAMAEKIAEDGKREFEDVSTKLGDKLRDLVSNFDHKHGSRIESLEARVAALEGTHAKAAKHTAKS